jgi:hypothetical protein
MKQHFWNKRIPTVLGIILIAIGIGITTFLVKQGGLFSINASPSTQPKNIRISNVDDNGFSVSYETSDVAFGVINYGDSPSLGKSGLDDRDQESGNVTNHNLHNITVRNLSPETKYYFSILSGKDTYLNNGVPFEITTGSKISDNPLDQEPISGKVILPNGSAPKESILYLTTEGSQVISALIKSDGTYILPLNSLRTSDFSSYFEFSPSSVLKLLIAGDGLASNVIIPLEQIQPVPTVTLSSDYDFTDTQVKISSSSANLQDFPSFSSSIKTTENNENPQILTPQKDQNLSDPKPQFKGTAKPDTTVEITIHSDEKIQTTVKTDANGNWNYRPSKDLSPGNHTITIIARDANGVLRTISQSFVVYASGSQIAGEKGSPTPTPVPTSKTTLTPTITSTLIPTQIPNTTITIAPTVSPTIDNSDTNSTPIPSSTLTPTIDNSDTNSTPIPSSTLTPTIPLPPTGNPTIISFGIVGLMFAIFGGLLFLLSRRSVL